MDRGTAVLFIVSLFCDSNQLLLPGRCPQMPSSDLSAGTVHGLIYVHVPFQVQRNASIFNRWQVDLNCLEIALGEGDAVPLSRFGVFYYDGLSRTTIDGTVTRTGDGKVFTLKDMKVMHKEILFAKYQLSCRLDATEKTHIWSDGYLNMFWSCHEDPANQRHDEAVIVTVDRYHTSSMNLSEHFSRMANRYLGQGGLRSAIEIPSQFHGSKCALATEEFVSCPVQNISNSFSTYALILTIPLVILMLLGPCICLFIKRKNRVDAVE